MLFEMIAFMLLAELVGIDCHWVQGSGALHYVLHYGAAFGLGWWCFSIYDRAR